jgi:hypothetical protein
MKIAMPKSHSVKPMSGAQIRRGLGLPSKPSKKAIEWAIKGLIAAGLVKT